MTGSQPAPVRPEDATSYEEFVERLGQERALSFMWGDSLRTRFLWAAVFVLGTPGYIFLLFGAVRGFPGIWWEWVFGLIFLGLAAGSAAVLIRHHRREKRRKQQVDRLVREWRDRALRGQVQLSKSGRPRDEAIEEARLRARMRVEQVAAGSEPRLGLTSMRLLKAGAYGVSAVVPMFLILMTAGVFGAPVSAQLAILALMGTFALAGFILMVIALSRQRREQARMLARMDQAVREEHARLQQAVHQDAEPPRAGQPS